MLPHQNDLIPNFHRLASASEPLIRCLKALETGLFPTLKGALMSSGHQALPTISGPTRPSLSDFPSLIVDRSRLRYRSSASVIPSVRSLATSPFEHIVYDPWGRATGGDKWCKPIWRAISVRSSD
jgi:hypothetical protein